MEENSHIKNSFASAHSSLFWHFWKKNVEASGASALFNVRIFLHYQLPTINYQFAQNFTFKRGIDERSTV
jgi:hypothetical protein